MSDLLHERCPENGWLLLVYDGATWIGTTPAARQNMSLLGVGTTANVSNPFSAKLNAALWTAKTVAKGGTGDLFLQLNKEAAGNDLGLTLKTGFVTKALVGLFGSDRFRLSVSANGSSFFDGVSVDKPMQNGFIERFMYRRPRGRKCFERDVHRRVRSSIRPVRAAHT
ncbi:hypothetical protein GCM10011316_38360 [Roseibium aquae]|uniref:Uncharacterized protein n=1 Tax=Roseibium aquae TaxID=1323746 RepID=A0A916X2L0_9HYPH|nr:hypothetical protein [Roseibium aquae]GGB62801.1 hypothetical protein GCM10011316_38360 [Roseibium aquae]